MTIDKVQQTLKYLPEGVEIKGNAVVVQDFFEALSTGADLLGELANYKSLEEQGEIIRLPICEDTPVYSIEYCCGDNSNNKMGMCHKGYCKDCPSKDFYIKNGVAKQCALSEIGKSVFFSQSKAEDKLKNMRSNLN